MYIYEYLAVDACYFAQLAKKNKYIYAWTMLTRSKHVSVKDDEFSWWLLREEFRKIYSYQTRPDDTSDLWERLSLSAFYTPCILLRLGADTTAVQPHEIIVVLCSMLTFRKIRFALFRSVVRAHRYGPIDVIFFLSRKRLVGLFLRIAFSIYLPFFYEWKKKKKNIHTHIVPLLRGINPCLRIVKSALVHL